MNTAELIHKYTDQPAKLSEDARAQLERALGGERVELYAWADLDSSTRLAPHWVAVGAKRMVVWSVRDEGSVALVARDQIQEVREQVGLSCTTLMLIGRDGQSLAPPIRFSHRQKRAMANIRYVLEQGREDVLSDKCPDQVYQSSVTAAITEAQALSEKSRYAVLFRLLAYLKPYRLQVALGLAGALLMTVVGLLPAYLSGRLMDQVIRPFQAGTLSHERALSLAIPMLIALAAIVVLRETFSWVRLRTMSMLGEYVASDLRRDVFAHLQKLSVSFFSGKQTGSLIGRASSDTDRIWDFIAFGVVEVSIAMMTLISLGTILLLLDWRLGLVVTLPVPLLLTAILWHGRRMQSLFTRTWRKWASLTDVLSDTIPGIRVVKAFGQERQECRRFNERDRSVMKEFRRIHLTWTGFWPKLMLSIQLIVVSVWVFALPRVLSLDPARNLSAGMFVSFLLYLTMFVQPIEIIGQMARMLNRATSSAHRIFELLDQKPQVLEAASPISLARIEGHVRFDNVSFSYDSVRQVLKGLSFEIRPGEMIGIVGPSGGGKSTLINLLARFYDVTGGRILVDGTDVRELETSSYRRQIGMVLQDPYLFHGTILDNIRYGTPEATLSRVIEAAKAANAHPFIAKLPNGYDTVVGERGHTLSGGERQRISIARAILHDPRILILDEATSAVDTETERKIQEALDRLIEGRTVLAIAHRLSTLKRASRLFVIENGKLKEQGTHAELLSLEGGLYAKLHRMQRELHEMVAL